MLDTRQGLQADLFNSSADVTVGIATDQAAHLENLTEFTAGGTPLIDEAQEIVPVVFMQQDVTQGVSAQPSVGESESAAPSPFEMETQAKVDRALAAIDAVMQSGHPLAVAWSSGKDSSVMLALVLEAARRRRESGQEVPQMLVTHANTGIENPAIHLVAKNEIKRIESYAQEHGLPLRVDVATPALNDSWAVRIVSGRALPTFANSSSRDCSINWKIKPQQRQRKLAFQELQELGTPVVMTGTRFDESTSRGARMTERGETDTEIWNEEVRNKDGKLVRTELRMSPIAYWTQEDIWVFLSELSSGERASYTDAKEIWDVYRDGGNSSCAVVADDALKASAKACGARFGCSLCTAVGRDKSLESMLESDPKYDYLVPLNRLQRFLVDTQYDLDRREWVGRTINDQGYIAIAPDSYSASMQRELLRYALSIDQIERRAARKAGVEPRFELISDTQLIAIDAIWSMQGYHTRPFEAIHIWEDVVINGNLTLPPSVDSSKFDKKMPSPRYLYVGTNWDDSPGFDAMYTGARHLLADLSGATEMHGCQQNIELGDGRVVMNVDRSNFFDVSEEGAQMFLNYMVLEDRIHERTAQYGTSEAFRTYQMLGTFSTALRHLGDQDNMLRRAAWKERHGVFGMSREELLSKTVSASEMRSGLRAPEGALSLPQELAAKIAQEDAARLAATQALHRKMGWFDLLPGDAIREASQAEDGQSSESESDTRPRMRD